MKTLTLLILQSLIFLGACKTPTSDPIVASKDLISLYAEGDTAQILQLRLNEYAYEGKSTRDVKNDVMRNFILLGNRELKFLRLDTVVVDPKQLPGVLTEPRRFVRCLLRVDSSYFHIAVRYKINRSENGDMTRLAIETIVPLNLSAECNKTLTQLYTPDHLEVKDFLASVSPNGIIHAGKVRLKNNTGEAITQVKFRLRLVLTASNQELFNRTILSDIQIPPGDLVEIDIPELASYSTGYLLKDGFWAWDVDIVDASPKPEEWRWYCEELARARALDRK